MSRSAYDFWRERVDCITAEHKHFSFLAGAGWPVAGQLEELEFLLSNATGALVAVLLDTEPGLCSGDTQHGG